MVLKQNLSFAEKYILVERNAMNISIQGFKITFISPQLIYQSKASKLFRKIHYCEIMRIL